MSIIESIILAHVSQHRWRVYIYTLLRSLLLPVKPQEDTCQLGGRITERSTFELKKSKTTLHGMYIVLQSMDEEL